ncbi:MAG: site-specific DNA-methyltransferase, partial [Thermodesulfovibrionales bacterium]|nr:site-specific DNA-methyltransferase [Thermodesulfovibrionales bacterium]
MAGKKKNGSSSRVESVKHKDKRKNIPTEELRDFVKEDEKSPKKVLYPRDPSLDPQLVWKGKDEQDSKDLEVPAVPIYIQEKIHPQAIVEDVRAYAAKEKPEESMALFADFNNISFEDLIEFYRHEQNWSNRMILGDSLQVMTSLAEKEGLKGKVQMIYIDPPYGIKFGSNWQVSTRKRDVKDGKAEDAVRQPEQIKAFRDTWQLGIHSYLAYLRDRLVVARELLTETGSCFVQIGDENVHLVRCLMDEVFGSENFGAIIAFIKTGATTGEKLPVVLDYLLWYSNNISSMKYRQLLIERNIDRNVFEMFPFVEEKNGVRKRLSDAELGNPDLIKRNNLRLFQLQPLHSQHPSETRSQPFYFNGKTYTPPPNRQWATSMAGLESLAEQGRIFESGNTIRYVRYFDEFPVMPLYNAWLDTATFMQRNYIVETNPKVIERCLLMTTDPGDIVLDPTCGSGTTAYVAEQWGRRWITCDTSRVSLALARTRLMSARYPYYHLADSPEGVRKEAEVSFVRHSREGGNP